MSGIVTTGLAALLFLLPLFGMHLYARAYIEPTIEQSSDCKDPNSRPGSRADMSTPLQLPGVRTQSAMTFG